MESFKWLNTWMKTNSENRKLGKKDANEISNILFGLDGNDMDKLDGEELLKRIERYNINP